MRIHIQTQYTTRLLALGHRGVLEKKKAEKLIGAPFYLVFSSMVSSHVGAIYYGALGHFSFFLSPQRSSGFIPQPGRDGSQQGPWRADI